MIFLLGIADILSSLLLAGPCFGVTAPREMVLFFSAYLILKGVVFLKDLGSVLDIGAGLLLLVALFLPLPCAVAAFPALPLGLKGLLTLFAH